MNLEELPGWASDLLEEARVARLGLVDDEERPRVLPVTFAVAEGAVWTAVDHKPKRTSGKDVARVRFLRRRPEAALSVDHYDDDWSLLAWVQLLGRVDVLEPRDGRDGLDALVAKYPPYRQRVPDGPLLRLTVDRALHWRAAD